jgi:hypothetical protein
MKEDKEGKKLLRIEKIPKKTVNKSSDEKKFVDKIKDFGKTTVKFLSWIKKQILSINFVSPSLSKLKKFINSYKKQFNVIILISSIFLFIFSIISLTANLDYLFGKQQSKIRYIEEDGIKYIGIKDGYITEKLIVEAGEKLPSVSDYFSPNYQLDQKHSITYYLGESSIPTETFSVKGEDGSLYVIGSNNTLIALLAAGKENCCLAMPEHPKPEPVKKTTSPHVIEGELFTPSGESMALAKEEEERKRQQEKEAIFAQQKAEKEAQKAAAEAQRVAEETERKRKTECEELIQEAARLKNAGEYSSAKKKLDKARKMKIAEKEEAITTLEKEVMKLKNENSFWGNISKRVTKAIETVLDEDKNE